MCYFYRALDTRVGLLSTSERPPSCLSLHYFPTPSAWYSFWAEPRSKPKDNLSLACFLILNKCKQQIPDLVGVELLALAAGHFLVIPHVALAEGHLLVIADEVQVKVVAVAEAEAVVVVVAVDEVAKAAAVLCRLLTRHNLLTKTQPR